MTQSYVHSRSTLSGKMGSQACMFILMFVVCFLVDDVTSRYVKLQNLPEKETVTNVSFHVEQGDKDCDPNVLYTDLAQFYKCDNDTYIVRKCGDNHCDCCQNKDSSLPGKARCDVQFLHLTDSIPALPHYVSILDMSYSSLESEQITAKFLANLSNIVGLNLAGNDITMLDGSVFAGMEKLKYLVLNSNRYLAPYAVVEVLKVPGLRQISVDNCKLQAPPAGNITNINSSVCVLDWSNNYSIDDLTVFADLHNLKYLDLSDCSLDSFECTKPFPQLRHLKMHDNSLPAFPRSCGDKGTSLFPQLETMNLAHNKIEFAYYGACLQNLKFLDMTGNRINILFGHHLNTTLFPRLSVFNISFQDPPIGESFYLTDYSFQSSTLVELRIANNALNFKSLEFISSKAFAGCPRLQTLDLSNTNFHDVDDDRFSELFGELRSLKALTIRNSQVELLFKAVKTFVNLTTLQLDGNFISEVPDGFFDSQKNLTHFSLSDNKITSVSQQTFNDKIRKNLQYLDLGQNPFVCDCELVWFTEWFKTEQQKFHGMTDSPSDSYKCNNLKNIALVNFTMPEQACLISSGSSIQIIVTFTIIILSLTVFSLVFRYRWHVRLILYEAFRGEGDTKRQHFLNNAFDFDVFLSYANEDLPWIEQHLKPQLEQRLGLRVCDHQRDFIPGKSILANIADCVIKSKKIIMVFSKHFVRSQWCQFELDFCLSHVLEYDDALIVMCVDDVASRDMTSSMMALLKTTTYIQWVDEADARMSFWGRLGKALQEIVY